MECLSDEKIRWVGYLVANFKTHTVKQLAEYIGLPPATLRTWICRINPELAGYIRIAFAKGPVKQVRPPKVKKPKVNPNKIVPKGQVWRKPSKAAAYPAPKKRPIQFQTKAVPLDAPEYRWVKENGKTWKQVRIDKQTA
jgi:hypothetical protein